MTEFRAQVEAVLTSPTLTYDQRLRQLAALAVNAMPYPDLSPACREALDKRVICDMYEGHPPYAPRYVLPDYGVALRQGLRYLELDPPTDLDDALAFLQIDVRPRARVTTYPVYLGDLDKVLAPFVHRRDQRRRARHQAAAVLDRHRPACSPMPSPTSTSARTTAASLARSSASSAHCARPCPTSRSRSIPAITPDDLIEDARTHRVRDRQAALRQPPDDGRRPRRAIRLGQLLQLAQDRRRLAHAVADEPEGGCAAPQRRRRRASWRRRCRTTSS